jgi:hypothetical protein
MKDGTSKDPMFVLYEVLGKHAIPNDDCGALWKEFVYHSL